MVQNKDSMRFGGPDLLAARKRQAWNRAQFPSIWEKWSESLRRTWYISQFHLLWFFCWLYSFPCICFSLSHIFHCFCFTLHLHVFRLFCIGYFIRVAHFNQLSAFLHTECDSFHAGSATLLPSIVTTNGSCRDDAWTSIQIKYVHGTRLGCFRGLIATSFSSHLGI